MLLRSLTAFKALTTGSSSIVARRSPSILSRWAVVQTRNLSALPQPADQEHLSTTKIESLGAAKEEKQPALFSSLPLISPKTLDALNDYFKYKTMTDVQHQVLSLLPTDQDLLVRAKTGTGKTLAFLIAALESALARKAGTRFDGKHIPILVISPTRELALQITAEAKKLTHHHRYAVMSVFGGTKRSRDMELFERGRIDILVATPGRLKDLVSSESLVKERLSKLETLILDEADQLMDMGFREEIEEIGGYLPEKRQTFMFSATISRAIASVANSVLAPGYKAVDTVPKNDVPTHLKTQQSQIVVPYSQQPALMYSIIKKHQEEHPAAKIIVFFPTTKVVGYLARVFGELPGMDVLELHSKLTQMQRQRISERFRRAYSSILFTSDVSARGVDYPGVTLVLQVGVPSSKDQYIHRIGRTGRAGKSGEGILILSPYERAFLQQMSDLPLKEEFRFDSEALSKDEELQTQIQTAYRRAPKYIGEECYLSFLGYIAQYRSQFRLSNATILEAVKDYGMGVLNLKELPPFSSGLLQQVGLNGDNSSGPRARTQGRPFNNDGGFHRGGSDSQGSFHRPSSRFSKPHGSSNYGDKSFDGRPARDHERRHSFGGSTEKRTFGDRPPRSFSSEDRPRRDFSSGDRPRRDFSSGDNRPRRDFGSRDRTDRERF